MPGETDEDADGHAAGWEDAGPKVKMPGETDEDADGHAAGWEDAGPSTAGESSVCCWIAASLQSKTSGNMGSGDGGLWARRVFSLVRTSSMVAATGSLSLTSSRRRAASHFLHRRRRAPLASSAGENSARLCAASQPKQVSSC